jgi:O-antigen/teichoic acid export membrane protein
MRKLFNNQYVFSLLTKLCMVFFGLLSSVFINRFLGPALKGEYAYILNIVNILTLILNLGIYQSYPFFKRKSIEGIKDKYIQIFFAQFLLYMSIAAVISLSLRNRQLTVIMTLAPIMVLNHQLSFLTLVEKIRLRNIINIISSMLYSAVLFLFFIAGTRSYQYIAYILFAKELIMLTLLTIKYKFKFSFRFGNYDYKMLLEAVKFGLFPMATALMITLNYKVDVIILRQFMEFEHIGYYTIGVGLAQMAWIIPDAFKEVLFSKTAKSDSVNEIVFALKFNFYLNVIILLTVVFLGKYIILVLYGLEFIHAYNVTIVIFAGIVPMTFFKLINTLFTAKGKQKFSFCILSIAVAANIVLNYLFIPTYGIVGAAIASVGSYTICGGIFLLKFLKEYELKLSSVFKITSNELLKIKKLYKVGEVKKDVHH